MPSWDKILKEIGGTTDPFDAIRRKYLHQLHEKTGRNIIIYYSGWLQKAHFQSQGYRFDIVDTDKTGFMTTINGLNRSKGLDLVLHTPGGSIATTESIVNYLRAMFGTNIRVIVPQLAMSAGTMIACSAYEIIMGKHSSLGPIDPQFNGIPTHGIIEEFETAKREVGKDPRVIPIWQTILSKYTPSLIGECYKAIEWSEELVAEWLKTGMFKDHPEKETLVNRIIKELGDHALTKSHGRQIPIDTARDKIGLNILSLEDDQELQDIVLSVHHACNISLSQTSAYKIIENHRGKAFIQAIGSN